MIMLWLAIGLFIFGYWFRIFTHEFSHLIYAKWHGAAVKIFKPYPFRLQGRMVLGAVGYYTPKGFPEAGMATAPLYKAFVFYLIYFILGILYWKMFLFLAAFEVLEFATFDDGYRLRMKGSDGCTYRELEEQCSPG